MEVKPEQGMLDEITNDLKDLSIALEITLKTIDIQNTTIEKHNATLDNILLSLSAIVGRLESLEKQLQVNTHYSA